jgi:hypothetical protein
VPTVRKWCSQNPAGIEEPPQEFFDDGYKPTTVGNNKWINYIYNQFSIHYQQPTGLVANFFQPLNTPPEGFLPCNGDTMGDSTSGATHANQDYEQLFLILWPYVLVTPSRGSSAEDDWAAHKSVTIPDMQGCSCIGDISSDGTPATNFLEKIGDEEVILSESEMPVMKFTITDPGHYHSMRFWKDLGGPGGAVAWGSSDYSLNLYESDPGGLYTYLGNNNSYGGVLKQFSNLAIGKIGTLTPTGHNNVQPSIVSNWFVKY